MRIPFWRRRRPTELVVTFTQEIDLEAVAAGIPLPVSGVTLVITSSCGGRMRGNAPLVVTSPVSVTQAYVCEACGDRVNVIYTFDAKQPEAV